MYNEQTDGQTDNLREYALTKRGLNKQIELPNIVMRKNFIQISHAIFHRRPLGIPVHICTNSVPVSPLGPSNKSYSFVLHQ